MYLKLYFVSGSKAVFFTGICITEQNILMYNRLVYLYKYIREVRKIEPVYFDLR